MSPNPFGSVPFGFDGVVSAGFGASSGLGVASAGLSPNPFGSVPFGFDGVVSAGFGASSGLGVASAGFVSNCVDNFDSFASNWAILSSRSFLVCFLADITQHQSPGFMYIWVDYYRPNRIKFYMHKRHTRCNG